MSSVLDTYIQQEAKSLSAHFATKTTPLVVEGEFWHSIEISSLVSRYQPHTQLEVLQQLQEPCMLCYVIDAKHIVRDKQLTENYLTFEKYLLKELAMITASLHQKPDVLICLPDGNFIPPHITQFEEILHTQWYKSFYHSEQYPHTLQQKSILVSYGTSIYPTSLLEYNNITTQRSLLSSTTSPTPLEILAQALQYTLSLENITTFNDYVDTSSLATKKIIELLQKKLLLYQKQLLAWHAEEEDIKYLRTIINDLSTTEKSPRDTA